MTALAGPPAARTTAALSAAQLVPPAAPLERVARRSERPPSRLEACPQPPAECGGGRPGGGAAPPPPRWAGEGRGGDVRARTQSALVLLLSAAHPPTDLRVVGKEGAALAAAGWRVRHLAPEPAEGHAPPIHAGVAIETYRRPRGWLGRIAGIRGLARRAAVSGATVLHASEPDAWLAAILAARRSGARVVLDVHEHYPSRLDPLLPGRWPRALGRAAIRAFCRWAARRADAVVVAKDGLEADFAAPPALVVAVRNYAAASIPPRRHAPGPVTLVHLGAIGRSRGWPQMLEALARCPEPTRLCVIGRFTDGSEADFAARAAASDLAGRVERRGWLPYEQALAAAARCDIALVLFQPGEENHRLALPHKLFDAMLAGLPVIAPDFATEVAAVVREAGCGVLVDPADPEAIAAAVAALAADPARRAALGAAGRAAAEGRFGWAAEAARLVALYRRLAPLPAGEEGDGRGD